MMFYLIIFTQKIQRQYFQQYYLSIAIPELLSQQQMNKSSLAEASSPIVEFSKLDQNNKAQFLQFLIRNNITFDKSTGKQALTAKITLKNVKSNKNNTLKSQHPSNSIYNQTIKAKNITQCNLQKTKKSKIQNKENQFINQRLSLTKSNKKNNTASNLKTPRQALSKLSQNKLQSTSNSKIKRNQAFNTINISSFRQNRQEIINKKQGTQKSSKKQMFLLNKQRNNSNLEQFLPKNFNTTNNLNHSQTKKENKFYNQRTTSPKINISSTSKIKFQQKSRSRSVSRIKIQLSPNAKKSQNKIICQSSLMKGKQVHQNNKKNIECSPFIQKGSKQKTRQISSKKKIRDKIPNFQLQNQSAISHNYAHSKQKNQSKQIFIIHNDSSQSFCHRNQSIQYPQDRTILLNKYKEYFSFSGLYQKNINSNTTKQRPICWPLAQIQKFLDQFYDYNFAKNTNQMLNNSKKLNDTLQRNCKKNSKRSHISETLQKFMSKKFNKSQKVIQYNLINLLYSVAFYVQSTNQPLGAFSKPALSLEQNPSINSLILFQDFIMQKLHVENYLFFLFIRSILKQQFKKNFLSCTLGKCLMTKKEMDRFLKHVVGNNNKQLLQEYHKMIFQQIQNYDIEIHKFVKIMTQDYDKKRLAAEQSRREKQKYNLITYQEDYFRNQSKNNLTNTHSQIDQQNNQQNSLENTFHKILNLGYRNDSKNNIFANYDYMIRQQNVQSMQELTFGQDIRQIIKQIQQKQKQRFQNFNNYETNEQTKFWKSMYLSEVHSKQQKQKMLKDQLNQMIMQRLYKKTKQLVQILSSSGQANKEQVLEKNTLFGYSSKSRLIKQYQGKDGYFYEQEGQNSQLQQQLPAKVEQMLFCKSMSLFMTVIQMNKVKWLKQLFITNPSQQDIQDVQQIQLLYRKIKQQPNAKDIAEFCKLILTVPQITQQLSKFFI